MIRKFSFSFIFQSSPQVPLSPERLPWFHSQITLLSHTSKGLWSALDNRRNMGHISPRRKEWAKAPQISSVSTLGTLVFFPHWAFVYALYFCLKYLPSYLSCDSAWMFPPLGSLLCSARRICSAVCVYPACFTSYNTVWSLSGVQGGH